MNVGGEWVYQRRTQDQFTKVTVVAFPPVFTTQRVTVRLADGETVDAKVGCLKTLWENEPAYTAALTRWAALAAPDDADRAAIDAAETIVGALAAGSATHVYGVDGALNISDLSAFSAQAGISEQALTDHRAGFFEERSLFIPWALTQQVVRRLVERNQSTVTDLAAGKVREADDFEEQYGPYDFTRGLRNTAQQLRAWCGAPTVATAEELTALREQLAALQLDLLTATSIARQAIELVNTRQVSEVWLERNVGRLEEQMAAIEPAARDR